MSRGGGGVDAGLAYLVDGISRVAKPEIIEATEADLAAHAQRVLLHGPDWSPRDIPADLPPLYEPTEDGEWRVNLHLYTAEQAHGWVTREILHCLAKPEGLAYFATHYVWCQHEHLDLLGEGRPPSAELLPNWDFVRAILKAMHACEDIIIEKSRDMMMSWMSMVTVLYDLLFRPNWAVMTVSRVETLVDDGGTASTVDSLHGKVRYCYEHLPRFLHDAMPLMFKYLQIRNPITRSHATGFSATPHAGRGPKWKRAILDEFAWMPNSEAVMTSVTRACPRGKALISTPNGQANAFYRIRQLAKRIWPHDQADTIHRHWILLTVHWSQHPERDEAWYRHQIDSGSMTDAAVAQELDISYERAVVGRVYSAFSYETCVAGASAAPPIEYCQYDKRRPLILCCDFNHDPLVWEIVQIYPDKPHYRVIGEIDRRSAIYTDGVGEFITRYGAESSIRGYCMRHQVEADYYDTGGVMLAGERGHEADVLIYGDATEQKKQVYNRQKMYSLIVGDLKDAGFRVQLRVPAENGPVITRIETHNQVLRQRDLIVHPSCLQLIKDYQQGVWDAHQKDMNQVKTDEDDPTLTRSHASSALGYYLVRVHKLTTSDRAVSRKRSQNLSAIVARW